METRIKNSINHVAGSVIVAMLPEYKQRNYIATALQIENKQRLGTATDEDAATLEEVFAVWRRIEAIRAKSNELEAQYVAAGKDLSSEMLGAIRKELSAI